MANPTTIHCSPIFAQCGELAILPLAKGVACGAEQYSRPLAGWLATYGKLVDGKVVPTVDRQGQVFDAAANLTGIDWSAYLQKGVWNDSHAGVFNDKRFAAVGLPCSLSFHDASSPLAKAHGKVGFFGSGRLFDRDEPASWIGLTDSSGAPRRPTDYEFERSDHFWSLAKALRGTGRTLGLSVEGSMWCSGDKRHILKAMVTGTAVCETPVNPDASLVPMAKAIVDGHRWLTSNLPDADQLEDMVSRVLAKLQARFNLSYEDAGKLLAGYLASQTNMELT